MSITQQEYIKRSSGHLIAAAEKSEVATIMVDLDPEEMEAARHQFQQCAIKLQQQKDDLKAITKTYKENMKPLQEEYAILLAKMKSGQQEMEMKLYHIHNHEAGMVEIYTEDGELHDQRRMTQQERSMPKRLNFAEDES